MNKMINKHAKPLWYGLVYGRRGSKEYQSVYRLVHAQETGIR